MNNFTKNDLRTGMVVKFRNGKTAILMGDEFKNDQQINNNFSYTCLDNYSESLKHKKYKEDDIMEVYYIKPIDQKCIYTFSDVVYFVPEEYTELIWKRERKIDWTKVPEFTRVLVRDNEEDKWKKGYFLYYSKTLTHPYIITCHGKFTYEEGYYCGGYKQIKIYDENDIKEEWYL